MEPDNSELSKLVQQEAKKNGISSKDARKAVKKLRSGGIMAQVAPELHSQFMQLDPNLTPRDRLRAKLGKMRNGRANKVAKAATYEKERKETLRKKEEREAEIERKKKAAAQQKKNHRKKLKALEKQLGEITQELYNTCMTRLQNDDYTDQSMRNRDRNITELYAQQQQFSDEIDMDDMDALLM